MVHEVKGRRYRALPLLRFELLGTSTLFSCPCFSSLSHLARQPSKRKTSQIAKRNEFAPVQLIYLPAATSHSTEQERSNNHGEQPIISSAIDAVFGGLDEHKLSADLCDSICAYIINNFIAAH